MTPLTAAMDNSTAWILGHIVLETASPAQKVGDHIDRGLILRRLLEEAGFGIVRLSDSGQATPDQEPR